jgi:hypothetical protein
MGESREIEKTSVDETLTSAAPITPPAVLIVQAPAPERRRQLWPAASLIVLALGLLTYRLSVADWHWEWPWTPAPTPAPLVAEAAKPDAAEAGVEAEPATSPAGAAEVTARPVTPEPGTFVGPPRPRPEDQVAKADPPAAGEATVALSDIEKEAERIRKEREELEKAKEEAGREISAAPRRPPGFGAFPDPALMARRHAEMERMMRRQMQEQRRMMDRMLGARPGFAGRGRMPQPGGDELEGVFDQLRREMEAFEREAEALMRAQRGGEFGPGFGRGRIVMPPAPDFDVPPPPEPQVDDTEGWEGGEGRPRVRRRSFVTPEGARVETFEMRWSSDDR